jgi:pimeloyl-ACP methyl ester carboxylesterase
VRDHWITADGILIHAVTWDPPERTGFGGAAPQNTGGRDAKEGERILLIHGLGANTITWEPVGATLAEQTGQQVTAIDLPGFGRTPLRECGGTLGRHGRLVTALLEQSGPATLVGNSMGGSIAVGVAARRPDLVRGLVLVDPAVPRVASWRESWVVSMRFSPLLVEWVGRAVIMARLRSLGPEGLVDSNLAWSVSDPTRVDPEIRQRLIELATERHGHAETVVAYSNAARSLIRYLWHQMPADLEAVRCPALIVHGELDRLVPLASVHALAELRPDFTIEILDDIGHAPQLETPERFMAVVTPWLSAQARLASEAAALDTPGDPKGADHLSSAAG